MRILALFCLIFASSGLVFPATNISSCQALGNVADTTYTLNASLAGAPTSAAPLSGTACIVINSSNVVFDCNGYTITNNGTATDTIGVLVNGSVTNVTVKNCGISQYNYSIYVYQSDNSSVLNNTVHESGQLQASNDGMVVDGGVNVTVVGNTAYQNYMGITLANTNSSTVENNTAYSNSAYGLNIAFSSNNTIFGNEVYGNNNTGIANVYSSHTNTINANRAHNNPVGISVHQSIGVMLGGNNATANAVGFDIYGGSNGTSLAHNIAANNTATGTQSGFYFDNNSNNNTLVNNTAYNSSGDGFYFYLNSFNSLSNNTAQQNGRAGFTLDGGNNSSFYNNTANNNSMDGFSIYIFSDHNNITNNTAYNNTRSGFIFTNASFNRVEGNRAHHNVWKGMDFFLGSENNTVANNSAYSNLLDGMYFESGSGGNTVTDNAAYQNTQTGFVFWSSSGCNVSGNRAYNNSVDGFSLYINSSNNYTDNSASNNSQHGFIFTQSDGNNVTGNNATGNIYDGFYLSFSDSNNFTLNRGESNGHADPIYAYNGFTTSLSAGNTFTNDTARNNSDLGFYIYNSSNTVVNFTAYENGIGGFFITFSSGNNITASHIYDNAAYAFYLNASPSNGIYGASSRNNTNGGFYIARSPNTTIANSNSTNGGYYGFLAADSAGTNISNCLSANNAWYGYYFSNSTNSTITYSNATNDSIFGYLIENSPNMTLAYSNASYNDYGLYLYNSSQSNYTGLVLEENYIYDMEGSFSSATVLDCEMSVTNITGSGGRPINYSNAAVTWSNLVASEIILCNASNSALSNITVRGSGTLGNNALFVAHSNNVTVANSNSSNNYKGFVFVAAANSTLSNCTTSSNNDTGIYIDSSSYSSVSGCRDNGSAWGVLIYYSNYTVVANSTAANNNDGFVVSHSNRTTLFNNTAGNASEWGIAVGYCNNSNLTGNTAYNSAYGAYIESASVPVFDSTTLYNNRYDLVANNTVPSSLAYNMTNSLFLNPSGTTENSTNLSVYDDVANGTAYYVNWSGNPTALSANLRSFQQKYVSIGNFTSGVSIDSATWAWNASDETGYNASRLELWKGNGTWANGNATLNSTARTLSISNISLLGTFAVLENNNSYPAFASLSPADGASYSSSDAILFNFTATDALLLTMNCTLYIDGSAAYSNASMTSGNATTTTRQLAVGVHTWNITCTNSQNNSNTSQSRSLDVLISAGSEGGSSSSTPISLQYGREACPLDAGTFTASPGAGTVVSLILSNPYYGQVEEKTAGSGGIAAFNISASGTYKAIARKSGYLTTEITFEFAACEPEASAPAANITPANNTPECASDSACGSIEYCNAETGTCEPVIAEECGYAANHMWNAYLCCQDSDCPEGNACQGHECIPTGTPPQGNGSGAQNQTTAPPAQPAPFVPESKEAFPVALALTAVGALFIVALAVVAALYFMRGKKKKGL